MFVSDLPIIKERAHFNCFLNRNQSFLFCVSIDKRLKKGQSREAVRFFIYILYRGVLRFK